MSQCLLYSDCPELPLITRGKVRDLYRVSEHELLFVASDRISAFDVVMTNGIPNKGKILTQLTAFWLGQLASVGPHHLITADVEAMPAAVRRYADQIRGRAMLVRSLKILPIEAIVRGYLCGSGWKEYQERGSVCGMPLCAGLRECERLRDPLFTPSTKAERGHHDENISLERLGALLGGGLGGKVAEQAKTLYATAAAIALKKGIIIADTKFEFGLDEQGLIVLADEVLTPDSSRFWPAATYQPGRSQPSFDKQFVRDYLESIGFDKTNPVELPPAIVASSSRKYIEAFQHLTGQDPVL